MNGIEREKVGPLTMRLWGLLTALAVWSLYVLTLAPTTGFWDTSEYVTTSHILGMPHPPGNPLFVLVGRVWELMLAWTGLPVALRINLLSATLSAGASFFWFLSVARIVAHFRENRHEVLIASIAAVWIGATAFTVWSQSNLNEKVYTLSFFVVAVVTYLAMRWKDEADTPRGTRLLLLIALLLGLGAANHTMSLLPLPALAVFVLVRTLGAGVTNKKRVALQAACVGGGIAGVAPVLMRILSPPLAVGEILFSFRPGVTLGVFLATWGAAYLLLFLAPDRPAEDVPRNTALRPLVIGLGLALMAVGYSVQLLFVPIRSAQNPIIDEADPECESLVSAIIPRRVPDRFGDQKLAVVCEPLALSLIRDQYGPGPVTDRQAPLARQMANYWQYFDWQWARSLGPGPRLGASMAFLFLALLGLWTHLKGDRKTFAYTGTLLLTVTFLLVYYLNFRHGYSLYAEEVPDLARHEVRERDYFYIIGFQLWGVYAGLGLATLWTQLSETFALSSLGGRTRDPDGMRRGGFGREHMRAAPLLAIGLIPLFFNFARADRTGDHAARDWAYNILQSVEPYAVLFTNGDNDTFPLWYLQEVEGIRRDVTVIVHSYLGTNWYPKQLRDLTGPCQEGESASDSPTTIVCQRRFDTANAVGPYQEMNPPPPRRSIIAWDDERIDSLNPGFAIREDTAFRVSDWITANVAAGEVILYPDIMVYHIIQQSLGDRPVYFAATAPPVFEKWGFQGSLVRHGLAFKLWDGPLEESEDLVSLAGQLGPRSPAWTDRTRTRALLRDVFLVDYLLEWDEWPEPSTESSIPAQYYLAYLLQGVAENRLEDGLEAAEWAFRRSDQFARLAKLGLVPD